MFTQAGFTPRYTDTGIRARIVCTVIKHRGLWRAQLIRFPSGDLAWRIPHVAIMWGTQVEYFQQSIHPRVYAWREPQSRLK